MSHASIPEPLWYVVYTFDDGFVIARAANWVAVDDLLRVPFQPDHRSRQPQTRNEARARMVPGAANMLWETPPRAAAFGLFSPTGALVSGVRWDWWLEQLAWITPLDRDKGKGDTPWPATTADAKYLRGFLLDMFFPDESEYRKPMYVIDGDNRINPPTFLATLNGFRERAVSVDQVTDRLLEDARRRRLVRDEFDYDPHPEGDASEVSWFQATHGFHPIDDVLTDDDRLRIMENNIIPRVTELLWPLQAEINPGVGPEIEEEETLPSGLVASIGPFDDEIDKLTFRFSAPGGWIILPGGTDSYAVATEPTLSAAIERINWLAPKGTEDAWFAEHVTWGTPAYDPELFQLLEQDGPVQMGLSEFVPWANDFGLVKLTWKPVVRRGW